MNNKVNNQSRFQKRGGIKTVEIGQIIPLMAAKYEEGLIAAINKNSHRRTAYFLLFTADWYKNGEELRTTFTPFGRCPPKMLNTICLKIDNKRGSCEEIWVLPKDAPIQFVETGDVNEKVAESAKGLPLIYGT